MQTPTLMQREVEETPETVARLLAQSGEQLREAGKLLRQLDPQSLVTIARGSSDHVATYLKYAIEISLGLPVASLGPSLASVYGTPLKLAGVAAVAISQSRGSPDIVSLLEAARSGGAKTLALVNVPGSPLAKAADLEIPLHAGPEFSVAATKSFIGSAVAGIALLAHWQGDEKLLSAIDVLPEQLAKALDMNWSAALEPCRVATSLYTTGRGPGFAMALEAALKLKETSILHAECFSGAEIAHGPVSLVDTEFPALAFLVDDPARPGMQDMCRRLDAAGARLFTIGESQVGTRLPHVATSHPLTEPLSMISSFYRFAEALSRARGHDPDKPRGLRKVTETV